MRVGPESAGADPGPACYGRSLLPTVTDAHVVLGHFGTDSLLGGQFKLDEKRAWQAMERLAKDLSTAAGKRTKRCAAEGVVSVANQTERAYGTFGRVARSATVALCLSGRGRMPAVALARGSYSERDVPIHPVRVGGWSVVRVIKTERTVMFTNHPADARLGKVLAMEREETKVCGTRFHVHDKP